MVEDAVRFETLVAVRTLVGPRSGMRAHVQRKAVTDPERFPAYLADVRLFAGMYPLVLHLLVWTRETPSAVLAFVPERGSDVVREFARWR